MTRRVVEKLCTKKICVDLFAPIEGGWEGLFRKGKEAFEVFL